MKKFTLFAFLVLAVTAMQAQDYLVSFTGSGLSTTVETVRVLNLAQGTSLTISGSDTLYLGKYVGIDPGNSPGTGLLIYPNPMEISCRLDFNTSQEGAACVEVFDITGKTVLRSQEQLPAGRHTYELAGLQAGVYAVRIGVSGSYFTNKIVSQGDRAGVPEIKYLCSNGTGKPKSTAAIVDMQYNDGERLLFRGISGNYGRVLTLVPTQSQSVDFAFVQCGDADSNYYAVVTIGTQLWMADNLKTTKLNNGTAIPEVTDNTAWSNLSTPGYCWYGNDATANKEAYGAMYNWYAVHTGTLCPAGWHVPADPEWDLLMNYLGGSGVAGGKLKETGSDHWLTPNTGATNEAGLTLRPGGSRAANGNFAYIGNTGYWWTSTEYNATSAWYLYIYYNYTGIYSNNFTKENGYSVRCIKD